MVVCKILPAEMVKVVKAQTEWAANLLEAAEVTDQPRISLNGYKLWRNLEMCTYSSAEALEVVPGTIQVEVPVGVQFLGSRWKWYTYHKQQWNYLSEWR